MKWKFNRILQTVSLLHEMHTDAGPTSFTARQVPKSNFPFRYQCFFYKTNTYFQKSTLAWIRLHSVEKVNIFSSFTIFYANTEVTKWDLSAGKYTRPCHAVTPKTHFTWLTQRPAKTVIFHTGIPQAYSVIPKFHTGSYLTCQTGQGLGGAAGVRLSIILRCYKITRLVKKQWLEPRKISLSWEDRYSKKLRTG